MIQRLWTHEATPKFGFGKKGGWNQSWGNTTNKTSDKTLTDPRNDVISFVSTSISYSGESCSWSQVVRKFCICNLPQQPDNNAMVMPYYCYCAALRCVVQYSICFMCFQFLWHGGALIARTEHSPLTLSHLSKFVSHRIDTVFQRGSSRVHQQM